MAGFESLGFTRAPENALEPIEDSNAEVRDGAEVPGEQAAAVETPSVDSGAAAGTENSAAAVPPVAQGTETKDEFIESFNKRFNTQYKADADIASLFEVSKKIPEYETKLKDRNDLAKSVEQYKKELDELKKADDPMRYFASPESYIAEQLRIKYKDTGRDPELLGKIARIDIEGLNDFDAIVDKEKLSTPKVKEEYIRAVLHERYGIDKDVPPEEWSELTKAKIAMDAASAKAWIGDLKKGIELPKVVSREERERQATEALNQKRQAITPLKEEFAKFSKIKVGGIEYDLPDDFKSKQGDMFDAYFINAGNEVTDENLVTIQELREALAIRDSIEGIAKAIRTDAETQLQAKIDAQLGNTRLPNTATASDAAGVNQQNNSGVGRFIQDNQGNRVRNL